MRLWSLHPRYLDARGLVALWREALLAQKVLQGATRGYRRHPQLERFAGCADPVKAIATYLAGIHEESLRRGYRFDRDKIARGRIRAKLPVTSGQVAYEFRHLLAKLETRDPGSFERLRTIRRPQAHPLFRAAPGPVADWEKRR